MNISDINVEVGLNINTEEDNPKLIWVEVEGRMVQQHMDWPLDREHCKEVCAEINHARKIR